MFSCNALEVIEGIESRVESSKDEENIPYMDAYWMEGNLSNSTNLNASWSSLTTAGATTIDITVYDQANCVGSVEDSMTGQPVTLTSHTFNPSSEGYYSFSLELLDDLGISMSSFCSDQIEWDVTNPLNPSNIGWGTPTTPGSDSNQPSQTIAWDASGSGDTASYSIHLFSDAICASPFGTDTLVDVPTTNLPVNGLPPGDYTFTITTTDSAGNSNVSVCSSVMSLDFTPPAQIAGLSWTEGASTSSAGITGNWTASADASSYLIEFYKNTNSTPCTGTLLGTTEEVVHPDNFVAYPDTLISGEYYSFVVTAKDAAGNESIASGCSPVILKN